MNRNGVGRLSHIALGALCVLGAPRIGIAQQREPLCVNTESVRLVGGPWLGAQGADRLVAQPLLAAGAQGERFVVAVRDPEHTLHAGDARTLARDLGELAYARPAPATARTAGLTVMRLRADLGVAGEALFVPDPIASPRVPGQETIAPALPVGVALTGGVLVLQRVMGDVYATVVPPSGAIPAPRRVATSPVVRDATGEGGFVYLTATARGDGAIALAGTQAGDVVAMRFDRMGAQIGRATPWPQRVGGPLQLLPTPEGPAAALLGRPVRGTGPQAEQARTQVLLNLNDRSDALEPASEPFATGFAQFPLAFATRARSLMIFQWVQQQGVAIATLPVGERVIGEQLPRLWYAQPPLDGEPAGHAAAVGPGNIVYDVVTYTEATGSGAHGHVAWVAPGAGPVVRRDVLPIRARLVSAPQLLPAADGVVVFAATYDETGGAVDAFHVRCELVTTP